MPALSLVLLGAWSLAAAPVVGQSFNIDVGTSGAATGGFGAPSAAFGAAAGQPGVWNNLTGTVVTSLGLVDLTGAATGVTMSRNVASGGDFGFDNTTSTGDFGLLVDDGQCGAVTYTFSGLGGGTYDVYTYAIAPDSATYFTSVTVPGSASTNPQNIGGVMPADTFVVGVTHALHTGVPVSCGASGSLTVQIAVATSFSTTDGFQLVRTSSSSGLGAAGAANPANVAAGGSTLLTVTVTPGPMSTGITVTANLGAIGGSATQMFFDNGTNGDVTANDNVFSFQYTIPMGTGAGSYNLPFTAMDTVGGSCSGAIALNITPTSDFPEAEPNDNKTQATPVLGIVAGQSLAGITTGAAGTGLPSVDYFRIKTGPAAPGIYKHRLQLTSTTAGHTSTIQGLTQTTGVVNPGTDIGAQTALTVASGTLPARTVQWFGFGKQEEIYYRVSGVAATTAPYFATLSTTSVSPLLATMTYAPGDVTIARSAGNTTDMDYWVYDGDLNAIPGYGRDGPSPEVLVRSYAAGTYYIAITNFNFANNQPQPPDDFYLNDTVVDFPNIALNSSSSTGTNLGITISDPGGATETIAITKPGAFEIVWVRFTVGSPVTSHTIVSANPPNGHRDTLQNTDPSLNQQGIGVMGTPDEGAVANYGAPQVTFSGTLSPAPTPANITVNCTGGACPTVTAVAGAGPTYTLTLSGQIPVLHCVTFTFAGTAAGEKLQYSSGPGDTNLNSTITGQDVLSLVNAINTNTTILARHDINRNGTVTGQDVLREVQLLNGGAGVSPPTGYNGTAVAPCP